jgi:hypothetical protein
MASIKDTAAFIIAAYPHKDELSNARLTKLVYLADWKHVLSTGNQITNVKWYFDNFGPFVKDVRDALEGDKTLFEIVPKKNIYGNDKVIFKLKDTNYKPILNDSEKASLSHVLDVTKSMYWAAFITLVYSTYPIASSERYSFLDLKAKAAEYQKPMPENSKVA